MKLINHKRFEISIIRIKGQPFQWKPEYECCMRAYHTMENGYRFKYMNCRTYFIPTMVRIFYAWWTLVIKIKPQLISGNTPNKYVKYEDTHLELMDIPDGTWKDK